MSKQDPAIEQLRDELIRLGPWHHDVQVTPEIGTRVHLDAPPGTYSEEIGFQSPRVDFQRKMGLIYPDGLGDRSVMDCACNCGGYLFYVKEIGAGECFGFEARELYVEQGRFLVENRTAGPTEGIRFECSDLYDVPDLGLEPFDVTLFQGILYHLPDVVQGLKIAADLTRELILVNTASWNSSPDGFLAVSTESKVGLSGVHGFNWFPTGPKVVASMLAWLGFPESRLVYWVRDTEQTPHDLGRLEVIAARDGATFEAWDREAAGSPLRSTNLLNPDFLPRATTHA